MVIAEEGVEVPGAAALQLPVVHTDVLVAQLLIGLGLGLEVEVRVIIGSLIRSPCLFLAAAKRENNNPQPSAISHLPPFPLSLTLSHHRPEKVAARHELADVVGVDRRVFLEDVPQRAQPLQPSGVVLEAALTEVVAGFPFVRTRQGSPNQEQQQQQQQISGGPQECERWKNAVFFSGAPRLGGRYCCCCTTLTPQLSINSWECGLPAVVPVRRQKGKGTIVAAFLEQKRRQR